MNPIHRYLPTGLGLGIVIATLLQADSPVRVVSTRDPRLSASASANGHSSSAALSADGRFVGFVSLANNLVTNDNHDFNLDVFVRDRQTGRTQLVSLSADGAGSGDGDSLDPAFSADGRWVVFSSQAGNLVAEPTAGLGDVYRRDLVSAVTTIISLNREGTRGGNGASGCPSITPDGRFILFESDAGDLAANDNNNQTDVFMRDTQSGTTTLVSMGYRGIASAVTTAAVIESSTAAVLTPDGRYVAFQSYAYDLVPNLVSSSASPAYSQVYVRDLARGTNILVSIGYDGKAANREAESPVLSADGRYVVFVSSAGNLVPNRAGERVYRRDLQTGTTVLLGPTGTSSTMPISLPAATADGRLVAYTLLVGAASQVYVWAAATETNRVVSLNLNGVAGNGSSDSPVFSEDGRTLAFSSIATDLVSVTNNRNYQTYVRDLTSEVTQLASTNPDGSAGNSADCLYPVLSADGRVVAFEAGDGNMVAGDDNNSSDVFARDLSGEAVELISVAAPGTTRVTGEQGSSPAENGISADGRYALFTSGANDLVAEDAGSYNDVFARDLSAGTNILVSLNHSGTAAGNGASLSPVMSPDGRFVAFISLATDLDPTSTNRIMNVYARDLARGVTRLASVARPSTALQGVNANVPPAIGADGRYVAFVTKYPAVAADSDARDDVYVRDLQTDTTLWVTPTSPNPLWPKTFSDLAFAGSGPSLCFRQAVTNLVLFDFASQTNQMIGTTTVPPAITPDGRYIAYQHVGPGTNRVWRYDALSAITRPVSATDAGLRPATTNWRLAISADGRFVAFVDNSDTLAATDLNHTNDVYVADLDSPGKFILASVSLDGAGAGNGASDWLSLSADGRFVAFRSAASDLAAGDLNSVPDIFVRDLVSGVTRLASLNAAGTGAGDNRVFGPAISANGRAVVFGSFASDLVPGDSNGLEDVFAYCLPPDEPAVRVRLAPFALGARPALVWTDSNSRTYRVQFKNSLQEANWLELNGNPARAGASDWRFEDASGDIGPRRFYRVMVAP